MTIVDNGWGLWWVNPQPITPVFPFDPNPIEQFEFVTPEKPPDPAQQLAAAALVQVLRRCRDMAENVSALAEGGGPAREALLQRLAVRARELADELADLASLAGLDRQDPDK